MTAIAVTRGVRMRADGATLVADCYRDPSARPGPAVLVRTPYDRTDLNALTRVLDPLAAVERGFAVVVQDVRGRFGSTGAFVPLRGEARDGAAAVAWVAAQEWCDGQVVMAGGSYCGMAALLTAAFDRPSALKAVAPVFAPTGYDDCWYRGGSPRAGLLGMWIELVATSELARRERAQTASAAQRAAVAALPDRAPLERVHELVRPGSPLRELAAPMFDIVAHPTRDAWWDALDVIPRLRRAAVAGCHVGGWFDAMVNPTIATYRAMSEGPGGADQRLVLGPWAHGGLQGQYRDLPTGPLAGAGAWGLHAKLLDFYAAATGRGTRTALAPVSAFLIGPNAWREYDGWPPPAARAAALYLDSDGRADAVPDSGRLCAEPPDEAPADTYVYDPSDPAPTAGGATLLETMAVAAHAGPQDQRAVERRPDVLIYTTAPISEGLVVAGSSTVTLHVATSAIQTDFVARLVHVLPDERAVAISDGVVTASGGEGTVTIALTAIHYALPPGHRLRLQVTSSSVPDQYPSPNTGHRLAEGTPPARVRARQTVFHDRARPSRLEVTVLGAAGRRRS